VRGPISRGEVVELARAEAPMLASAIVPGICLGLGSVGLLGIDAAFELALIASIVQLFVWGLAVGRASHSRWSVALGVALVDSALGLAVVVLKVLVIH
jgi:hypothetical protein